MPAMALSQRDSLEDISDISFGFLKLTRSEGSFNLDVAQSSETFTFGYHSSLMEKPKVTFRVGQTGVYKPTK